MRAAAIAFTLLLLAVPGLGEDVDYYNAGMAAYQRGDYAEAARLLTIGYVYHPENPYTAYNAACSYALAGDEEMALAFLDRAIELGVYLFVDDSDFDSIRGGEGFQRRVEKVGDFLDELNNRDWEPFIFVPEAKPEKGYPVLVALHGYGGSPSGFTQAGVARLFTDRGFLYAVPYGERVQGPDSFAWSGGKDTEETILKLLDELDTGYGIDRDRVYLMGFSQGGAIVLALGLSHPEVFDGVISLAGNWATEWESRIPAGTKIDLRVYLWVGSEDAPERRAVLERAAGFLQDLGVEVRHVETEGVGHALPEDPLPLFAAGLDFVSGSGE